MAVPPEEEQAGPAHCDPELATGHPDPKAAMPLPGRKIPDRWEGAAVAEGASGVVIGTGMGTCSPAVAVDLALAIRRSEASAEGQPHLEERTAAGFAHSGTGRALGAGVLRDPECAQSNRG